MQCVRCGQPLSHELYERVEIDRCGKCGGTWLDAGELARIVSSPDETFSRELIARTLESRVPGIPGAELESEEACPKCKASMTAVNYAVGSGVIIDSCPRGHGIWLDGRELEKVQIVKEHGERELNEKSVEWHHIAKKAGDKARADLGLDDPALQKLTRLAKGWLRSFK